MKAIGRKWCWKRADVVPADFKKGRGFTTLVKPTKLAPGPPGPEPRPKPKEGVPLLYAATLTKGKMPPLPGF